MGCKEKQNNTEHSCVDKQLPGDYFPAFPKSWWNYHDLNNNLIKYQISSDYQEFDGKCYPVLENVTYYQGDKAYVQGNNLLYRYYCGQGAICRFSSLIYSLAVDSIITCSISFSTLNWSHVLPPNIRRVTTKIDTTITVSSRIYQNVIIVKEYDILNMSQWYLDYFAKNIGLIKRDSISVNDTINLITILTLDNYFIGN